MGYRSHQSITMSLNSRILILLGVLAALSGCTSTPLGARFTCLQLKAQGQMFSTLESCQRCVEAHGAANLDQLQGCALGMDASSLIELGSAAPRERSAVR
jgi:hypothetical protein